MNSSKRITVSRASSLEERKTALTQIYYQTLERQPYGYERKIFAQAERDFLHNKIGVRRFLKELGHSSIYLDSFYYPFSNAKFLDLCFKHFMGRAIRDGEEMRLYCDILMTQGVNQVITSILDSEEYRKVFGCFTVPYMRQDEKCYHSPRAYMESRFLKEEHIGQRGRSIPTLYWHELGLDCNGGLCRHPEADEVLEPLTMKQQADLTGDELLELLRSVEPSKARQVVASLSAQQREALRQAIL